jgi:hypothetical protein
LKVIVMTRWLLNLIVLVLVVPLANAQGKKAIDVVPEDALGFIVVKDLQQLSKKVEMLAKKVKAPAHTSFLEQVQQMGPNKGLNTKGSVVMIALKGQADKDPMHIVVALPIADYPTLVKELGVKDAGEKIMLAKVWARTAIPWHDASLPLFEPPTPCGGQLHRASCRRRPPTAGSPHVAPTGER